MALVERLINASISIGQGDFGEAGADTVELKGYRISARVVKAGGNAMSTAQVSIFGMTLSRMNKLSTLGLRPQMQEQRNNTITLTAGDEDGAMSAVFDGTITNAWSDFQGAPNVPFQIVAHTGRLEAMKPVKATSYKGSVDAATILSGLATLMGKKFENNGVDVKLVNPYYSGTARAQAMACVKHAGINWNGLDEATLAIWPAGQSRGGQIPLISPSTGMIGYPSFTANGILLKTLFAPSLGLGNKIKVESSIKPACGEWVTYSLAYALDSKVQGGLWEADISAAPPGYVAIGR